MPFLRSLLRRLTGPLLRVTAEEKAWIEARFRWLQSEFGADRVMVPVLKPTLKIFPRVWNGTIHECRQLTTDLCEYMEVERDRVDLSFFQKTQNPLARRLPSFESSEQGAAGVYHGVTVGGRFRISIASEQLARPAALVATICHELGHVRLLGENRIARDVEDNEALTDLLTIYFGAGIFTANSAFDFRQWTSGQMQGWSSSRLGYLSEPLLAHALASYAWLRGESRPDWRSQLEPNIAPYFDDALHYLETTRDTVAAAGGGLSALREAGGFDMDVEHFDDWSAWLRLADRGASMFSAGEVVAEWRVHEEGLSGRVSRYGAMKAHLLALFDRLAPRLSVEAGAAVAAARRLVLEGEITTYDDYVESMARVRAERHAAGECLGRRLPAHHGCGITLPALQPATAAP